MCQVSTSGCNTWVSGGWGRNITKFIRSNKKKHWHSREICWILNTLLISVPNRILLMSVISSVETNSGRINWSPLSKAISSLPCFWRILVRENFEANAWWCLCEEHASFDVIYGRYLYNIVHQSFIWPLRMFYQFWRVNFLSTFKKGWVSMHLRFCKGCNLAPKMSFSNLPCLPFRTVEPGWDPRGKKPDISTSPVPWTEHLWTILNWGWLQPRNQHSKATNRVIPSWTVLSLETQNLMDISWALETWFFLLSFFEFVCKSSMIYCESVIYFFFSKMHMHCVKNSFFYSPGGCTELMEAAYRGDTLKARASSDFYFWDFKKQLKQLILNIKILNPQHSQAENLKEIAEIDSGEGSGGERGRCGCRGCLWPRTLFPIRYLQHFRWTERTRYKVDEIW